MGAGPRPAARSPRSRSFPKSTPARSAAKVTARYIAPVSSNRQPSRSANLRATVLLPAPAGPSIVTTRRMIVLVSEEPKCEVRPLPVQVRQTSCARSERDQRSLSCRGGLVQGGKFRVRLDQTGSWPGFCPADLPCLPPTAWRGPEEIALPNKTTARYTARIPRFFEEVASGCLEMTYADRSRANSGLSTTCGISSFAYILAVYRIVETKSPRPVRSQWGRAIERAGARPQRCRWGINAIVVPGAGRSGRPGARACGRRLRHSVRANALPRARRAASRDRLHGHP